MAEEFESNYAVNMTCDSCVSAVTSALEDVPGISLSKVDLESKSVWIKGTALPSTVISAIESTGRDAVLRGSGVDGQSAVCILEDDKGGVWGLIRMVGTHPGHTVVDCSLSARYFEQSKKGIARIHEFGDLSNVPQTTGSSILEMLEISCPGSSARLDINLPEYIGRSVVLEPTEKDKGFYISGVVARSAGLWGNDKEVCACSGKTLWEERRDEKMRLN